MWEQTQLIIQTIQLAVVLAILVLHSITQAQNNACNLTVANQDGL